MRIVMRTREKCVFLSGRLDAARRAGENQDAEHIARQLGALWMRLPEIEATLNARSAHPLDLYCKLAGMAGALARLQPGRGGADLPGIRLAAAVRFFETPINMV